jgi:hypothetical protein
VNLTAAAVERRARIWQTRLSAQEEATLKQYILTMLLDFPPPQKSGRFRRTDGNRRERRRKNSTALVRFWAVQPMDSGRKYL